MVVGMARILFIFIVSSVLFPQENCILEESLSNRSLYNIGDTLSDEDQNIVFPVCNGANNYMTGDSFSFSDLNGDLNGGEYKISIISMNATW
jgi:hypothetical protein